MLDKAMSLAGFSRVQPPPSLAQSDQSEIDEAVKRVMDGALETAAGTAEVVKAVVAQTTNDSYTYSGMKVFDENGRMKRRLTPWDS